MIMKVENVLNMIWQDVVGKAAGLLLVLLPKHPITMRMKGSIFGILLKEKGKNFQLAAGVQINHPNKLRVGKDVYFGPNVWINANYELEVGDNVSVGPMIIIVTGNHAFQDGVLTNNVSVGDKISIGNHTWIGGNATILPGVKIGNHVTIGAGSVVTKDIPDHCVAVGVPARVIRGGVD